MPCLCFKAGYGLPSSSTFHYYFCCFPLAENISNGHILTFVLGPNIMLKQQYFLPVWTLCIQGSKHFYAAQRRTAKYPCYRAPSSFTQSYKQGEPLFCASYLPFEFIIGSRWKGWAFDDLTHFLSAEAEVVYGPHVGKLHHFNLKTEDNRQFRAICIHANHLKRQKLKFCKFYWVTCVTNKSQAQDNRVWTRLAEVAGPPQLLQHRRGPTRAESNILQLPQRMKSDALWKSGT